MKIHSVRFRNNFHEWEYDTINFFDLTLLVGISGVGKSQILKSILSLWSIAEGSAENGLEWEVKFSASEQEVYVWKGAYDLISTNEEETSEKFFYDEDGAGKANPKIISEELFLNNNKIVDRNETEIVFDGNRMPKLSSHQSILYILKEEALIQPASDAFNFIIYRDHTEQDNFTFRVYHIKKFSKIYKTIEQIKESDLDSIQKLALVFLNSSEVFKQITDRFIEVFPSVQGIRFKTHSEKKFPEIEAYILQIKEEGVNRWIPYNRISSGMLRTLLHISEMLLLKNGTVVLIDEFENSLGVNCIDTLTEDLIYENPTIQFIATSHHPYIINKIPFEYWKIVTRYGGKIKAFNATEFELGESKHDRFMSLINLPAYQQGIKKPM